MFDKLRLFFHKNMFTKYILNILISLDQLLNVLLLGDPDETISSRVGKNRNRNFFWKSLSKLIDFFFGKDHTKNEIEDDEGKDALIK